MNRKRHNEALVLGLLVALGGEARAAVVIGPDGRPMRVEQGQTPPPSGGDADEAPPPVQLPPGSLSRQERRRQRLERRMKPPGSAATPGEPPPAPPPPPTSVTPPPPSVAATTTTTTTTTPSTTTTGGAGSDLAGEKEFNSCRKFPAGRRIVKLNLKPETELGDLIAWISSITCKQFLLPGTIPANSKKVTIIAPQLITPEEAYRLFLAALDSVGLTVEPSGKFLRIIETLRAKTTSIPVYGADSDVPNSEGYVTRLVRVDNADVNEVAQVLGRLKGEQGDVIVYAPQGALVITDTASNINRMIQILTAIDQPGTGEKIWIVSVRNTAATEMASKLAEIFQVAQVGGKKGGAPPPAPGTPGSGKKSGDLAAEMTISKIIPDERSNQLIVIANDRAYARVLQLVRKLDVPVEGGDGRIHVYYCANANCDELAQTLGAVTGVAVAGAAGGRTRTRGQTGATPPAPTPSAPSQPGQQSQQAANMLFEGEVRINFDRPTNSLIVVSSLKDYQSLRRVVELLDSPRKQVFVEAMILEVTLDKTRDLGAAFHGAVPKNLFGMDNPSLIVGGLNPAKTIFPASSLTETMLAGVLGPVLSPDQARALGTSSTTVVDIPSFGVLIKALQTNSDVDVLSNPHILIMNNEEGEITVGSRVPFPVSTLGLGAAAGASGAAGLGALGGIGVGGLFPQVQREKVALEMKLTPHVNEHDMVRLEVDEKISELAPGSSNLGPSTSERTAKTIVVAKDEQTILIGGLYSDKTVNSVTKIPILGDIPILGFFFRNTTKKVVKTNLIIALTPYIIADQSDLRRVLEKKMKERREFVERYGGEERPPLGGIDSYRRKVGMIEEINKASREVEAEEHEMEVIRLRDQEGESGPMELPPGFKAGASGTSGAPVPPAPADTTPPAPGATPGTPAPAAPAPAPAAPAPAPTPAPSGPPPVIPAPPVQ